MSDTPPTPPSHRGPPLSAREIRFCRLYVETGKKRQSYKDAGFKAHKSDNGCSQAVRLLLAKPQVQAFIDQLRHDAAEVAKLDLTQALLGVKQIGWANITRLYDKRGNILPPDQWPKDLAEMVDSVESEELYEQVPDEGNKRVKRKQLRGFVRKVKLPNHITARLRILDHFVNAAANGTGQTRAPMVIVVGPEEVPAPPLPAEEAPDAPAAN